MSSTRGIRKLLALILTLTMVLGCLSPTFAAPANAGAAPDGGIAATEAPADLTGSVDGTVAPVDSGDVTVEADAPATGGIDATAGEGSALTEGATEEPVGDGAGADGAVEVPAEEPIGGVALTENTDDTVDAGETPPPVVAEEGALIEEEGRLVDDPEGTDGMIPFVATGEGDMAAMAEGDLPTYYATLGDIAVAVTQSVNISNTGTGSGGYINYQPESWIDVTLTPATGAARPARFYTSSNSNSNQAPRGALFLKDVPAGTYAISYSDSRNSCEMGTLVVSDGSVPYIAAFGGASMSEGITNMPLGSSSNTYGWLTSLLEYGGLSSGSTSSSFYTHADGSVYLAVQGANLDGAGTLTVQVNGSPVSDVEVIPAGGTGGIRTYLLRVAASVFAESSNSYEVSVKIGELEKTATLNYSRGVQYYLDLSEVEQLKLHIVPVGAGTPPASLRATYTDDYYNNVGAHQIGAEQTVALAADGRYTLELKSDEYLFGEDDYFYVNLYANPTAENPSTTAYVGTYEFLNGIELPTGEYSYSGNAEQILAAVNGQQFYVRQYGSFGQTYRANPAFNLLNNAFVPVEGLTISATERPQGWSPSEDFYKITATAPLTVGSTYYLSLGSFPIRKLTAVAAFTAGTSSGDNQINGNSYTTANSRTSFYVDMPGKTLNANEWSARLTDVVTGAATTYSVANGNLTSSGEGEYLQFSMAPMPAGLYEVAYFRGGTQIVENNTGNAGPDEFSYVGPDYIVVTALSGFNVTSAGTSYNRNNEGQITSRNFRVYASGTAGAQVSGMTVTFYPFSKMFFDRTPAGNTINLGDVAIGTNGSYSSQTLISDLGLTPGFYIVVVRDGARKPLYVSNLSLTSGWFEANAVGYSLSGTVTLRGQPAAGVQVNLSGTSTASVQTIAGGTFNFTGLTNGNYTVNIPAGSSWAAYTHPTPIAINGASQAIQITLVSTASSFAVTGKVTADGAPVQNYRLDAYASSAAAGAQPTASVTTAADGTFTFNLVDGEYIIKGRETTDYFAYDGTDKKITVAGAAVTVEDIALILKPYITGKVATAAGTGVAGLSIYLYELATAGTTQNMVGYVKSATSGTDGAYTLKGLKANTNYELRAYGTNYEGTAYATTAASGGTTANITLTTMATVSGTVTKSVGGPAANVSLYLSGSDGSSNWAYTDVNGKYTFNRVKADGSTQYTIRIYGGKDYAEYNTLTPFAVTAEGAVVDITLEAIQTYPVTFTVNNAAVNTNFALYVYNGFNNERAQGGGDTYTVSLPVNDSGYSYYYYYEGIYGYGNTPAITSSGASVVITLPTLITISGTVNDSAGAVGGASVSITGAAYLSAVTKPDGTFSVKTQSDRTGSLAVTVRHATKGYGTANVTLDGDTVVPAITLQTNSVTVTVTSGATPIGGAYVYVGSISGYTGADGVLTLRNIPQSSAYVYASKYGYLDHSVNADIQASGDTAIPITLEVDPSLNYTLSLGLSNNEITSDGFVTLTATMNYTGEGSPESGNLNITLPAGLAADKATANLPVSYTSNEFVYKATVKVTGTDIKNLAEFHINARFTGAGTGFTKSAHANLTVVNATLNAPNIVTAGTEIVVYGTAPSESIVAIKAIAADGTESTLKTANVASRYFRTTVSIPTAGEYQLYAVSVKGDATNVSPVVDVTAVEGAAPSVTGIDITDGYLGSKPVVNPAYGVPTFSTWVLRRSYEPYVGQYRGIKNIRGSFQISNLGDYTVKDVRFTDGTAVVGTAAAGQPALTVSGNTYSFAFPIDSWGGVGVEPIELKLEKDGREYTFTIAIVTLLIDPAGYVYDKITNERIEGATVTLEEKKNGVWFKWDDPDGLQPNPQTTDIEGKYGWMVPAGEYRVIVAADDYATAIANNANGTYTAGSEAGFPVPPEQTEVNVPLTYTGAVTATAAWVDGKLVVTFNRPLENTDANVETLSERITLTVDGAVLEGTWAKSDDNRTFTFTPATALTNGKVIKIVIDPNVSSVDGEGFSLGTVTVPDVTVTATTPGTPTTPPGSSTGGGGGGGGGTSTIPPQKPAEPAKPADGTDEPADDDEPADTATTIRYSDVNASDWFAEAVAYVTGKRLMVGIGDNLFGPDQDMTRAMLVTVLYRHAGSPRVGAAGHGFTDVPAGEWYTDAVAWAFENDIVMGYSDELFAPDDSITREQIVVILNRYAQMLGIDVSNTADIAGFEDADSVSDWAFDAMTWAYAVGLIRGRTDTTIVPDGTATRAEVATLLMRFTEDL